MCLLFTGCANSDYSTVCEEKSGLIVPIIMYHGITESEKLRNKYMIPPALFESDLQFLKENGYTTIFVSDLINYFEKGTPLPEKPIILTFDDGYYNNYVYAFPVLKKYGYKAVISPIGISADEAETEKYRSSLWSQCKWSELKEMADAGIIEIGNHTYNLHRIDGDKNGAAKRRSETDAEYEKRLKEDLITSNQRIKENIGKTPVVFVYPFGAKSEHTEEIVRSMSFGAILDCENKINRISGREDLYHLHRFLRPDNITGKDFFINKVGLPA